jgi:hypothetical protein
LKGEKKKRITQTQVGSNVTSMFFPFEDYRKHYYCGNHFRGMKKLESSNNREQWWSGGILGMCKTLLGRINGVATITSVGVIPVTTPLMSL